MPLAPYSKQLLFHEAGAQYRERALLAGNQVGKTFCASMELAFHLTGRYPEWWKGRVFPQPTHWWAASISNEKTREQPQGMLCGDPQSWGTGAVPGICMGKPTMQRGFPTLIDTIKIRHASGGWSKLQFKAYEQGWDKFSGATLDGVWLDEEPEDPRVFSECLARIAAKRGLLMLTATPLLGMSEVVSHFYPIPDAPTRWYVLMDIGDAGHFSEAQRAEIIAQYPEHEREARTKGIPMLGSGRIFTTPEKDVQEEAFEAPPHWPAIVSVDFGYDHPFAAVKLVHEQEADVVHLTHAYRKSRALPPVHVAACKHFAEGVPVAWPHDGLQHEKDHGTLAAEYRSLGFRMLPEHAQWATGGYAFEPGISEMQTRLETGRLRVARHLADWWEEYRVYHRKIGKDGRSKVVKINDDLLSATRIGLMSLRFARTRVDRAPRVRVADADYDPLQMAAR